MHRFTAQRQPSRNYVIIDSKPFRSPYVTTNTLALHSDTALTTRLTLCRNHGVIHGVRAGSRRDQEDRGLKIIIDECVGPERGVDQTIRSKIINDNEPEP